MHKLDLLILLRSIFKNPVDHLIRLLGLSIGFFSVILIFCFILFELSFDRFHQDADRIYRLEMGFTARNGYQESPLLSPLAGEAVLNDISGIEQMTRLFTYSWKEEALIEYEDRRFYEKKLFLVDSSFFKLFAFKIIKGPADNPFNRPNSVVLSESCAEKYFGDKDPLGKVIRLKNFGNTALVVSAVVQNAPSNAHFSFDLLIPLERGQDIYWTNFLDSWFSNSFYTYIRISKNIDPDSLAEKINKHIANIHDPRLGEQKYSLISLKDIHLHSHHPTEIEPNGNINKLIYAGLIGFIILLVSLTNYSSIAAVQIMHRSREIGLKKVLGKTSSQLSRNMIAKSFIYSFLAMLVAIVLIEFLSGTFIKIFNMSFQLSSLPLLVYPGILILWLGFALLAGITPAIILRSLNTYEIMKGQFWRSPTRFSLRRMMLVLQLIIIAVLLICTAIIFKQNNYIQKSGNQINTENVLVIPVKDHNTREKYEGFRSELLKNPSIEYVCASSGLPFNVRSMHKVVCDSCTTEINMISLDADYSFFDVYGIQISDGRKFSREGFSDKDKAYLINEAAARALGWEQPLGQGIQYSNTGLKIKEYEKGRVIGIMKDFHHSSVYNKIDPLLMKISTQPDYVSIRYKPESLEEVLQFVSTSYEKSFHTAGFDYFFADVLFNKLYANEESMKRLFSFSSIFAVVVCILSIMSITGLEMKKRAKEIGIRKVLGAPIYHIILRYLVFYSKLVVLAFLIGLFPAIYFMSRWLDKFAYATSMEIPEFLLVFLGLIMMMILSVLYYVLKAARTRILDIIHAE